MPTMTRHKAWALGLLVGCCLILALSSCLGKTSLRAEAVSPTGKYRAELREGDTGAVGGWMSAIRISRAKPGVWARLLGREGDTVFGAYLRSTRISFVWEKEDRLRIVCAECQEADISLRKYAWEDVTISYNSAATQPTGK